MKPCFFCAKKWLDECFRSMIPIKQLFVSGLLFSIGHMSAEGDKPCARLKYVVAVENINSQNDFE